MALLGTAALAMWWEIAPDIRTDFEDWHAHEHFPERLGIPGFRRGTRWCNADDGDGMFVLYELDDHAVLSSPAYVARLNAPSPWSTRLMPHHRNMVRSQCLVLESRGGGIARHVSTVRLSPASGADEGLRAYLRMLVGELVMRSGITGAHLLMHRAPDLAATTEQKIRSSADQVAAWVFVVSGYGLRSLEGLLESELSDSRLIEHGAERPVKGTYTIAYSATPTDVR